MTDPEGRPGEMPVPRRCTAMHPSGSRGRCLISESDSTDTSKCPYMSVCNHRRCRAISRDIREYGGIERCTVHYAPRPEVAR